MSSTFYHKPELALRRALELQGIHQNEAALTLLHDVLSSRRHRTWSPAFEQIMIAYLNLCLKMHRAREAKDGLHQYRNLAQSQAPGSLEKVIRYLLEKADDQCKKAKASADAAAAGDTDQSTSILSSDDDDMGIGPQAILLSSMSTDPAKSQRDSLMLLPSLKFLWEIYRAVLDILRSNSKLEHVYHSAAVAALKFCRTYQRRTEFRRLCDMLRMHLGNLQKYGDDSSSKPNNKVRGWEGWTTEAIELHLETRFSQLETASALHLYTEGFRTVEDIYNILQISHHRRKNNPDLPPPKAKLMAKYYEQLTTLFWVSENYLFHAFAWYKYYSLCKEYNKGMSDELKAQQASAVLLAALCIPSLPTKGVSSTSASNTASGTSRFDDSVMQDKMARMATLLGFHTRNPTRHNLLEEVSSRGLFEQVPEYLQKLYSLLETDSDPLVLVETAKPLLDQLTNQADETDPKATDLGQYVKPLRSVLLLKLLWNLSSAYHTVRIDFLKELTSGLGMTFEQVEKTIVLFTQSHNGLALRIDHRAGCLRFGDAQLESDEMRHQLTALGQQLDNVCATLSPENEAADAARTNLYNLIRETRLADHTKLLERKAWIEQRKEEIERLAQEKIRQEEQQAAAEEAARKAEEERRIQREQKLREQEKQRKIQEEMETTKKQQLLQAMGHNTESMTTEEVAAMDTVALQKEHQDKINKKKEEAERKTREAAKRLDYLVRAVRIEELPLIKAKYEEKVKMDREQYEHEVVEKTKSAKEQWESDKQDKERLACHFVFDYMRTFQDLAMKGREMQHDILCKEADDEAEIQAEKAKMQRARKRKQDEERRLADEEARLKREEEERKMEEERRKKEEARREREAKDEELRKAEAARMAEARERKGREQQDRGPRSSQALDKAAGGGGKYVPPSQRRTGGAGSRFEDRSVGSRYDDRGGSRYGGGRYEGRSGGERRYGDRDDHDKGPGNDRRSGYGGDRDDRDRGFGSDRRGGGYGGDRREEGGGSRWRR